VARLQLNKSALSRQTKQLKTYEQFLPSLDLKRRQLMAERAKAVRALAKTEHELKELQAGIERELPMLSNQQVDLTDIAKIKRCEIDEENVVGTRLPRIAVFEIEMRPYGYMAKPHWVDRLALFLRQALELRVRVEVEQRRVKLLNRAVQVITQRVNLFEKVLIPKAREDIKRIKIYLSDLERAAVVNSKIAKRKRARETA
jgi:V/A-type H+-transporting ATPase subunit D